MDKQIYLKSIVKKITTVILAVGMFLSVIPHIDTNTVYAADKLDKILISELSIQPWTNYGGGSTEGHDTKDTPVFTLHKGGHVEISATYRNSYDGFFSLHTATGTEIEKHTFANGANGNDVFQFEYSPDQDEDVFVRFDTSYYGYYWWSDQAQSMLSSGEKGASCKIYNYVPLVEEREAINWSISPIMDSNGNGNYASQNYINPSSREGKTVTCNFVPTTLTYYYTVCQYYSPGGSNTMAFSFYNTDDPDTPFYSESFDNKNEAAYDLYGASPTSGFQPGSVQHSVYLSIHTVSSTVLNTYRANFSKPWYITVKLLNCTSVSSGYSEVCTPASAHRQWNPTWTVSSIERIPQSIYENRDMIVATFTLSPQIDTNLTDVNP